MDGCALCGGVVALALALNVCEGAGIEPGVVLMESWLPSSALPLWAGFDCLNKEGVSVNPILYVPPRFSLHLLKAVFLNERVEHGFVTRSIISTAHWPGLKRVSVPFA